MRNYSKLFFVTIFVNGIAGRNVSEVESLSFYKKNYEKVGK